MPKRPAPPDPAALLPLSEQVFQVLLSLVDADRHGYGIMRDVAERTGGAIQLGAGTLYGSLKRLLRAGLIEELDERPEPAGLDDERRRYYRLTPFGTAVARSEARRLAALVQQAQRKRLLAPPGRPRPA